MRACVRVCVCIYIYSEGVIYTYMGGADEEGIYFHKQSCLSERKVGVCVGERERKCIHPSFFVFRLSCCCVSVFMCVPVCVCVRVCVCV